MGHGAEGSWALARQDRQPAPPPWSPPGGRGLIWGVFTHPQMGQVPAFTERWLAGGRVSVSLSTPTLPGPGGVRERGPQRRPGGQCCPDPRGHRPQKGGSDSSTPEGAVHATPAWAGGPEASRPPAPGPQSAGDLPLPRGGHGAQAGPAPLGGRRLPAPQPPAAWATCALRLPAEGRGCQDSRSGHRLPRWPQGMRRSPGDRLPSEAREGRGGAWPGPTSVEGTEGTQDTALSHPGGTQPARLLPAAPAAAHTTGPRLLPKALGVAAPGRLGRSFRCSRRLPHPPGGGHPDGEAYTL